MKHKTIQRLAAFLTVTALSLAGLSGCNSGSGKENNSAITSKTEVSSAVPTYDYGQPVPRVAGDWASKSYFSDAAFIGDSVTTGLSVYSFFENATILAERGIDPANISEKTISSTGKTILEGLKDRKFGKIYIMLGANAAVYMSTEEYISAYEKLLDEISALQPDAVLYIESVFPITEALSKENEGTDSGLTNETIRAYNTALLSLAKQKQVYYVDTFDALQQKGVLPEAYSPDGVHINAAQYQLWYDYLRSHVITK